MNPLPSPMAVHMVCECPLSVSCRERERLGAESCVNDTSSRFLLPIYFLSPKHFSHLHMIRPYIVFWKADCYLSIQFSMERKDRGTVLLVGNEITSVSRLGWVKMHDVFRYWLPGHFWKGLYVK